MSFASAFGGAAANAGMGSFFGNINAFNHQSKANGFMNVIDPLGSAFGSMLGSEEDSQDGRSLKQLQRQLQMQTWNSQVLSENAPTWSRTGMEKAGFNPLLSLQSDLQQPNMSASGQVNDIADRRAKQMETSALQAVQAQAKEAEAYASLSKRQEMNLMHAERVPEHLSLLQQDVLDSRRSNTPESVDKTHMLFTNHGDYYLNPTERNIVKSFMRKFELDAYNAQYERQVIKDVTDNLSSASSLGHLIKPKKTTNNTTYQTHSHYHSHKGK